MRVIRRVSNDIDEFMANNINMSYVDFDNVFGGYWECLG
jgi:hypothetical protein